MNKLKQNMEGRNVGLGKLGRLVQRLKYKSANRATPQEIAGDSSTEMLYAYRYLLNREPEDMLRVTSNTRPWQEIRREFKSSDEFLMEQSCFLAQDVYTTQRFLSEFVTKVGAPDYERILEQGYRKLIKKGDTVIDVGAHEGRHLTVFQKLVGDGKLFAFEPLPKQFMELKKTFRAPNISLYNFALSDTPGKSTFYELPDYPEESGLRLRLDTKEVRHTKIDVEVHCMDEYEEDLKGLNYIKIDAEGAEVSILKGAEKLLRRYRPFVSTEYGRPAYSVYGLNAHSLYEFCEKIDYFITDLWGNIMWNSDVWGEMVDTCYWDFFLVPKERMREFYLAMHRVLT